MADQQENKTQEVDLSAAYPNPDAVRKSYSKKAQDKAGEFTEEVSNASEKLSNAEGAATKKAQGNELIEERKPLDVRYRKKTNDLLAEGNLLETEKTLLEKKRKNLKGGFFKDGPLQTAQKRVQRKAKDIQLEIKELTQLKDVMKELLDAGIPLSDEHDMNGDGASDAGDLLEIETKIAELEKMVESDPVLKLLEKQLGLMESSVGQHERKLGQNEADKTGATSKLITDLKTLKSEIAKTREANVEDASKVFNKASGARQEAVGAIYKQGDKAYAAEQADLDTIKSLEKSNVLQTAFNTLSGAWEAFVEAIEAFRNSTKDAYAEETPAAAAKRELLEARAAASQNENKIQPK